MSTHRSVNGERLIVYCKESDRYGGAALHEWLIRRAMDMKLAGGTVHKGVEGFGRHLRLHHEHLLSLSDDMPLMVVLVDVPEQIGALLADAAEALAGYTYTREPINLHMPHA